jgi:hypothetical protein
MRKSPLHILEVPKDIGVVEFEVVEYGDVRLVVDEFATLIEERAVVLVTLDDKGVRGCAKVASIRRVLGHTADQVPWVSSIFTQEVGCQRRCGCLTMGSRNHDILSVAKHLIVKHLRKRSVWKCPGIQKPLNLGIPTHHGVPNDNQVRLH